MIVANALHCGRAVATAGAMIASWRALRVAAALALVWSRRRSR